MTSFGAWAAHEYGPRACTVMTLCPGFTKTEFHQRMDVAPRLRAASAVARRDRVVDDALADWDAGKRLSIPSKRYKVITGASRHLPTGLLQRFQSLGRR